MIDGPTLLSNCDILPAHHALTLSLCGLALTNIHSRRRKDGIQAEDLLALGAEEPNKTTARVCYAQSVMVSTVGSYLRETISKRRCIGISRTKDGSIMTRLMMALSRCQTVVPIRVKS